MPDLKKVIKGLEICVDVDDGETCPKHCPYYQEVCHGYGQLMRDALALLKEPGQKWISVEDRLPEIRHAVLAYSPFHKNIWAVSMHDDGEWYYWLPASKKYDPDWQGPITHWMSLPEIPED